MEEHLFRPDLSVAEMKEYVENGGDLYIFKIFKVGNFQRELFQFISNF